MNCEHCGVSFEESNRAKRFCDERWRKRAERKRYKAKKRREASQEAKKATKKQGGTSELGKRISI